MLVSTHQLSKFRNFIFIAVFCIVAVSCSAKNNDKKLPEIHVLKGFSDFIYLIEYQFTPENLVLMKPISDEVLRAEGGQFEAYIKKELFPISAPYCNKFIILNMPATKLSVENAEKIIEEKIALYKKLLAVSSSSTLSEKVVIELNPYSKIKNADPLELELTQCNVFFRNIDGRYINTLSDKI